MIAEVMGTFPFGHQISVFILAKHLVVISISLPSNHTFTFEPQPDDHPLDLARFNNGTFFIDTTGVVLH